MTDKVFWLSLVGILLVGLGTRSLRLDADAPTDVGRDYALTTDGSWYVARALDGEIGRDCDITDSYDRRPFTMYTRAIYSLFGPSVASTNFVSVPPSILAILFCALAARALGGNVTGLLGAAFLAFNYSFFVFNRNPVIYSFLAMFVALVVWLIAEANRREKTWIAVCAWIVALAAIVTIKEIGVFVVPALLLTRPIPELLRRRPRVSIIALAALGLAGAGAGVVLDLHEKFGQKLRDYFPDGGLSELWALSITLEARTGFFRALPLVAPLALLAGARHRLSRTEVALWSVVVLSLFALLPFEYSPLRYTVILFPVAAALAANRLGALLRGTAGDRSPTWWRAMQTPVLLVFAGTATRSLASGSTGLWITLWIVLAIAIVATIWIPSGRFSPTSMFSKVSWTRAQVSLAGLILAVTLAVGVELFRTSNAFASSRFTTREAVADLRAIVGENAIVTGSFAHVLTSGNDVDRKLVSAAQFGNGRLREIFESRKATHMTFAQQDSLPEILARFRVDGAKLEYVHSFLVRDIEIHLYRFHFADEYYELSDFELGAEAMKAENPNEALSHFETSVRNFPNSAAAHAALATTRMATNDLRGAEESAQRAIELNAWELRALGILADLRLRDRRLPEARALLERMHSLDPSDERVAKTLEELARFGVTN